MRATISFEDSEDGVVVGLNFDDALPEDPEDASDAQVEAMLLFQSIIQGDESLDVPDDEHEDHVQEVFFNDGESEEASREV